MLRQHWSLIICGAVVFVFSGASGVAMELHVGPGQQYATIQEALAHAEDGYIIKVHPDPEGYPGNITVSKAVYIWGWDGDDYADPELVFIDGDHEYPCMQLFNKDIGLASLTLTHGLAAAGGAVYVSAATVTIDNCHITNSVATYAGGGIYIELVLPRFCGQLVKSQSGLPRSLRG